MESVILPKNKPRDTALARLIRSIHALPINRVYAVEIKERRRVRSVQQNRFLWLTYQRILDDAPEELRGWTREDLHEWFLGNHFGWETIEGFGRKRMKPMRRSSKLSTVEFMDFVDSIQIFMAERGVVLPDPDEELQQ